MRPYRLPFILGSILTALIAISVLGQASPPPANAPSNDAFPAGTADVLIAEPPLVSQNGIDVSIDQVERADGVTRVIFYADNHRYDLSTLDARPYSLLADQQPIGYALEDGGAGGHHIRGILTFAGDLRGRLRIGLSEDLIFSFRIL
ncbi:hypothetical protein KJZ71_04790 [Patescibacteria group bacterium]|uniref:DUF2141 domain-containing protein n=1 Tax=candidate division WWE3 bacterium TaxID=2053526 RepID=A0A928Y5W3_UNCKA|nr:hypothetical protein [candidate division WWE3 bacterium]MCL4733085.1 hypothetical protein [Patescibacteria group bacterium]MDL1953452.1 hypothetical protein [Candidatus Uhrbacteria bacterium UHB]RIL00498.1 MAG: hypothetical protein DCC77_02960 [Candidatus Uhrbacteria bacterium]